MLKELQQKHLNCFKKSDSKNDKATGGLIGNKTVDEITKVSRTSPRSSSETVESERKTIWFDIEITEISRERYTFSEKKPENYWWSKINVII